MAQHKIMAINQLTENPAVDLALDTLKIGKQALVFANSKRSAEKTAEDIADELKANSPEHERLSYEILNVLPKPTVQCERLAKCIRKGVAFHHAGLAHQQKELIEENFRKGAIKIICCTPTLAMGVDLPSFRTILKDLRRFASPRGMVWIPVLEYQQMAGRSGRPSYDKYGEAIAVANTEKDREDIYNRYICGVPEEIYSKLAVEPALRMYVLSLIATEFVSTRKELLDFFEKTFWAHQFRDMGKIEEIISKVLCLLEEYEFIRITKQKNKNDGIKEKIKERFRNEFTSAAEISDIETNEKIEPTELGGRAAQLYIDPLTAFKIIEGLKKACSDEKAGKVDAFSFLSLISTQLEIRPFLRVRAKEQDIIEERLAENEDKLIVEEPTMFDPDYDEFLDSVKTALFFGAWIDEKDEQFILENFDIRPGEIMVKLNIADWLLYSAEEFAKLLKLHRVIKEILRTRTRLKYGIKEELIPLVRLQGIGRARARKLYDHGIKDIGYIKKADIIGLSQLIGKNIAINLKKQVGQEFDEEKIKVKENKRKGQISLMDYQSI